MSVPNQTPYNIYTANGLTTVFAYEFYLISASDIQVTINGNEVTSGYTVSGVGNTNGGEITFLTAPANGSTVIFERVTPTYRLTDYQDNGDLLADTVNKDFDRLWMAIQRAFIYLGVALRRPLFGGGPFNADGYRIANLGDPIDDNDATTKKYVDDKIDANTDAWKEADKKLDQKIDANFIRTLRVPESYIGSLPSVVMRRNKIVAMNNDGNPIMILPESGSASDVMIELAKPTGASNIGGLGFLTPEMFSENITLDDDFSLALHRTIEAAKKGPVKLIILGSLYKISSSFDIPDGVTIRGGGPETGVYLETAPAEPMHIIFNMACVGSRLENFGVYFNTGGQGSISAVQVYGVFLQANSKDCTINGLTINGKPGDTVMGFSNGIRCTGAGNKILFCDIQYCSMGITHRGEDFLIDNNYCNNHFVDEFLQDWYPTSPFWDGITGEGSVRCTISNNTCECNGQSGIYLGGNGSYSHSNKYLNNTVRHNFNRGIDIGVSGTPSETNDVNGIQASGNFSQDNRTVDLWIYESSDAVIVNNVCKKTSEYETIFGAYSLKENRQALAAAGFNCNILGNRLYTTKNDNFSYSASGTNTIFDDTNFINDGASGYIREVLFAQKFKNYKGVTTPVLRAGSNNISMISSSAAYTIDDNSIIYEIDLHLTASGGNGNLYIGTFNPLNGLLLKKQSVEVTYVSGMNNNFLPGSELFAYFLADDPAQLCIARRYGSDIISDIPACIGTGTRIRLIAKATVNTTTKTNDATGISLFGHSFLSEQGFANGVSESLGLRAFNYARGGANSTETALVFGAYKNSYMPAGGFIPASGAVELSPQEEAVWNGGAWAYVTLAGVEGIINATNVGGNMSKITFTRSSPGEAVSVPSAVPMTVLSWVRQNSWSTKYLTDHPTFKNDIVIIQCMRNNASWAKGISDVTAIVNSLGTGKFVILPEFPYSYEKTGTAGATTVTNYNAQLKAAWPDNYCEIGGVDLLQNFKNHHNPDYAQDVTDIGNGITPSSLRYDNLHPSRYRQANALWSGVQVNADFVARFIKSKGWA